MLTATVCVALSGAGLALALLTAWRRRFVAAARLASLALLPAGLYLTGLVTLGARIGRAVGGWGAGLVLDPSVWAGFAVLALAVVLYAAARLAAGRRGRSAGTPAVAARTGGHAVAPPAGTPSPDRVTGTGTAATTGRRRKPSGGADDDLSEFRDIEEILRKRGI